jgi:hypothetical protein
VIRLTQGTKQYVLVPIKDLTGAVTSLVTATYDVTDVADPTPVDYYTDESAVVSDMDLYCMIDTSATGPTSGVWDTGKYRLFVKFPIFSEIPRLGPIDLLLINA